MREMKGYCRLSLYDDDDDDEQDEKKTHLLSQNNSTTTRLVFLGCSSFYSHFFSFVVGFSLYIYLHNEKKSQYKIIPNIQKSGRKYLSKTTGMFFYFLTLLTRKEIDDDDDEFFNKITKKILLQITNIITK